MLNQIKHREDEFDLVKHNFLFGIEEIDPTLGRIEVNAMVWAANGTKESQPIEMVHCKDLADSDG